MPQVKLISPITRQEIRKIRVDSGIYQPHSEKKRVGAGGDIR